MKQQAIEQVGASQAASARESIEASLAELQSVFQRGQQLLEATEARRREIERSLTRLDGAIQVMEQALSTAKAKKPARRSTSPARKATAAFRALSPVRLAPRAALAAAL